ncbi:MAG TPA: single-stranded DNA-binding protein [Patescibacteria group bacterium]|nr:single-stranded DNA-binding protein [Patescibacteria group bacterium]
MARSLNRVQLIGNLTRDPELRYTPTGTAVCSMSIATNRSWTTDQGEKREETDFHRIVAWSKLAELCSQLLAKGRKVYVEGRLSTRKYTDKENNERTITEVVIDDMIILDNKRTDGGMREEAVQAPVPTVPKPAPVRQETKKEEPKQEVTMSAEEVADDIPF